MQLLFKTTTTETATSIVGDTNFRNHYPAANRNMAWASIKPFIRQATKNYILPTIGSELYNDLATLYNTATPTYTYGKDELLEYLQDAIAYYTVYDAMPSLNTTIADMGVVQNNATEGTAMPTNQWSFKTARWQALLQADKFLDQALAFLQAKVKADVTYYDLYKDSDAYFKNVSSFFRHTSDLNEHLNIQNSYRTFVALSKYLTLAEEQYVLPIFGQELYDELKDQVAGEEAISEENEKLLKYIRKIVANAGMLEAVPHLTLVTESDGFKIVSSNDGFDDRKNLSNFTHRDAIAGLAQSCEKNYRTAIADLIAFLYKNKADYPLWVSGGNYVSEEDSSPSLGYESATQTGGVIF